MSRYVLITGGGGAIGAALASGFVGRGDRIVLVDRNADAMVAVAEALRRRGGHVVTFACDLSDADAITSLREELRSLPEKISVLVNNAGIEMRAETGSHDYVEIWRKVMAINIDAAAFLTQSLVEDLENTRGSVINVASIQAHAVLHTANTVYAVSKAAIAQLTRAMAVEYAPRGIRVNAVAPGVVETAMIKQAGMDPARFGPFLDRIPMKRFGRPEEIAGPVCFLSSVEASYVTGVVFPVDGGFLAV